ncbi:hypothetical protein L3X38_007438 [Prunus dulcis]|uniref:Uncharacterized protein n=1 Tax=Prunus dulcis TaxID=3755 RepID=A0AAD5F650_PRUDU|nr:hypothetical protein L3X38_007438 [Prunus dulcis]
MPSNPQDQATVLVVVIDLLDMFFLWVNDKRLPQELNSDAFGLSLKLGSEKVDENVRNPFKSLTIGFDARRVEDLRGEVAAEEALRRVVDGRADVLLVAAIYIYIYILLILLVASNQEGSAFDFQAGSPLRRRQRRDSSKARGAAGMTKLRFREEVRVAGFVEEELVGPTMDTLSVKV